MKPRHLSPVFPKTFQPAAKLLKYSKEKRKNEDLIVSHNNQELVDKRSLFSCFHMGSPRWKREESWSIKNHFHFSGWKVGERTTPCIFHPSPAQRPSCHVLPEWRAHALSRFDGWSGGLASVSLPAPPANLTGNRPRPLPAAAPTAMATHASLAFPRGHQTWASRVHSPAQLPADQGVCPCTLTANLRCTHSYAGTSWSEVTPFSSVPQSCPTLCNPMDCSTPGLPVHRQLPELTQTHAHRVSDAIQPSHPLSSPSPPALNLSQHQGFFSNESVLWIRWPKYWSFSFSISPSNEYSGLISFRMNWLDLLAVQGALKSLLQHHSSIASILWCSAFFRVQLSYPYVTTGETIVLNRWTFVGKNVSAFQYAV